MRQDGYRIGRRGVLRLGALGAVGAGASGAAGFVFGQATAEQPAVPPLSLTEEERSTIALFEATREAVVAISTADRIVDPWTRRSYEQAAGSGSGFIYDAEGHIVTNDHVIRGRSSATVALADGRTFPARLVGRDPANDLAVLRIETRDLPEPLPLGLSGDLQVGQVVLAIGNPFGLDWTLTTGIVSALDRELPGERGTIRGLIQTDAAINPGNSGGPLLDSGGRIIGVNTAIFSPSGASAGIGFAVPVGTVRRVVPQLIETGRYRPPGIGIEVDARVNAAVNRQGLEGVLILGLRPGGPAARVGLEPARIDRVGRIVPGDVIVSVDGVSVRSVDELLAEFDRRSAGDAVRLGLRSGRREREVTLTLEQSA